MFHTVATLAAAIAYAMARDGDYAGEESDLRDMLIATQSDSLQPLADWMNTWQPDTTDSAIADQVSSDVSGAWGDPLDDAQAAGDDAATVYASDPDALAGDSIVDSAVTETIIDDGIDGDEISVDEELAPFSPVASDDVQVAIMEGDLD